MKIERSTTVTITIELDAPTGVIGPGPQPVPPSQPGESDYARQQRALQSVQAAAFREPGYANAQRRKLVLTLVDDKPPTLAFHGLAAVNAIGLDEARLILRGLTQAFEKLDEYNQPKEAGPAAGPYR